MSTRQNPAPSARAPSTNSFSLMDEHLGARLARDADPAREADRDEDVHQPGAQHRHDEDDEEQAREGVHHVDEAREDEVDAAADDTRTRAPMGTPISTTMICAPSPTSIDTRAP